MAIAILQTYGEKLKLATDRKLPQDEIWVFKKEVYSEFGFHPQALTDFLERLAKESLVRFIWRLPSRDGSPRDLGGPAFKLTEDGKKAIESELKSLLNELKALFA